MPEDPYNDILFDPLPIALGSIICGFACFPMGLLSYLLR